MTANEEKNELVVVDVPNVQIYAFTVSGWPTPRTAEEVLNAARKSTAESIQRITQIIESGDYESDRGYWENDPQSLHERAERAGAEAKRTQRPDQIHPGRFQERPPRRPR